MRRGDEQPIAAICREHLALADDLARALTRRLPFHVEADVLKSAARLGLWHAAQRFDASRGVPFPAFARPRVLGAIVDELRVERRAGRLSRAFETNVHPADEQLARYELLAMLERAVKRLPRVQRELVEACFLEDKPLRQSVPGLSKSRAARQLARALDALKEALLRAGHA